MDSLYFQAPQEAHRTEGRWAEEREGGRGYQTVDEEEDRREDRREESDWPLAADGSSASRASFTGEEESLMDGADRN